jgi:hypothetical protein
MNTDFEDLIGSTVALFTLFNTCGSSDQLIVHFDFAYMAERSEAKTASFEGLNMRSSPIGLYFQMPNH